MVRRFAAPLLLLGVISNEHPYPAKRRVPPAGNFRHHSDLAIPKMDSLTFGGVANLQVTDSHLQISGILKENQI